MVVHLDHDQLDIWDGQRFEREQQQHRAPSRAGLTAAGSCSRKYPTGALSAQQASTTANSSRMVNARAKIYLA
jgi:hypothetical protein